MRAVLCGVLGFASSAAYAEPPGETPVNETPVAPPAVAAPDPIAVAAEQPLAERAIALGTALTVPSGTVEVSSRYILGVGVVDASIGVGRTTEVWLEAGGGAVATQAIGVKQVLARGARWQLALEGSVRRVVIANQVAPGGLDMPVPQGNPAQISDVTDVFSVGVIGSACIDAGCHVLASVAGNVSAVNGPYLTSNTMWLGAASVIAGSGHWHGVVEVMAMPNPGDGTIESMMFVGGRLGGRRLAVELGVTIGTDDQDSGITPTAGLAARL